jgi:cytoskeletal protein CcmA (bactofilin family)
MPSTYTLNNGIELIATGEQSGTWGDTTNVNLALIDTALDGQVTITLASAGSSGSPNNLPISDGAASNGRNRLIIFTDGGDLGATAFVQLTPNDAEKIVYVRNNLTGGRAITLFQGTYNASNDYEVPAGTTAVVFFTGAGAGAVAANVFNNAFFDSLRLGAVSVTAILDEDNMASNSATALSTQQSIKAYVDAQVGANNELSEVLANGNTSGGTDIQMTTTDEVQFRDAGLKINSSVDGQLDIAADVELEITAPTVDINASTAVTIDTTTLTVTGSVNVVGDLDVDNLNLNGNAIISTNTDGNIDLTPNGTGEVNITKVDINGGTIDGTVIGGSTPAAISGTTGTFSGDLTVDTDTLFVDASENRVGINNATPAYALDVAGDITATGDVRIGNQLIDTGADSTSSSVFIQAYRAGDGVETGGAVRIRSVGDGAGNATQMIFDANDAEVMRVNTTGAEVTGNLTVDTDTLFVNATNNRVGVGTASPSYPLDVQVDGGGTTITSRILNTGTTATDDAALRIGTSGTAGDTSIFFGDGDNATVGRVTYDHNNDRMEFWTNSAQQVNIVGSAVLVDTLSTTPATSNVAGAKLGSRSDFSNDGGVVMYVNRVQDGTLVSFRSAGNGEGTITVTGTTVSYNGGHLSRWSQTADNTRIDLLKGTVMTNLDQMAVWGDEDNEQLNCMAISSVEGDPNVAGVFVNWDDDDEDYVNDMNIAMTGDMIIRIAQGATVQRGDLLMSAGDGTAKPQGDDIIRSKTIAKVTSTHVTFTYEDGSYCVPCVLMAC